MASPFFFCGPACASAVNHAFSRTVDRPGGSMSEHREITTGLQMAVVALVTAVVVAAGTIGLGRAILKPHATYEPPTDGLVLISER